MGILAPQADERVKDAVTDLVGNLVRVAFRDRLGGEEELVVCEVCGAHGGGVALPG